MNPKFIPEFMSTEGYKIGCRAIQACISVFRVKILAERNQAQFYQVYNLATYRQRYKSCAVYLNIAQVTQDYSRDQKPQNTHKEVDHIDPLSHSANIGSFFRQEILTFSFSCFFKFSTKLHHLLAMKKIL